MAKHQDLPLEIVTHEDLEINEHLEDYVEKKIRRLVRPLENILSIRVDLTYNPATRNADSRARAQITIRGKRLILRTEEYGDDVFTALDKAVDAMERRVERIKGRRYGKRPVKHAEIAAELMEQTLQDEIREEEARPRIVRRKRFLLTPMDEEEAIEQMELLGHDRFFIFLNARTNQINVLYKRRDGSYGLIEPELG